MIAIVKLKKYMANAYILRIVVNKLNHQEKSSLIILRVVDKSLKIGFYHTVLPLCLAISLSVKGGGELLLNPKKVTE